MNDTHHTRHAQPTTGAHAASPTGSTQAPSAANQVGLLHG